MNVGGHRITNPELVEAFEAIGFEGASAYRAAGNVIFDGGRRAEGTLVAAIEEGLEESLGYAVPTFVRSDAEVGSIAEYDPFDLDRVAASKGKLQVSILGGRPSQEEREEVLAMATDEDPLVLVERELYWLPSGGLLESALDLDEIDRILGSSTRRTKGTIEGIAKKLGTG
jgi:uncharacterized protein (DUF1697 family)